MSAPAPTHDLVLDLTLNAPRDKLWRCWSEPALLEQWFCPKPWWVTGAVLDMRVGGRFSCTMHGPNGETFPQNGSYLLIEPGQRLVTTDAFVDDWRPSGKAFMVADTRFSDHGDGTTRYVATARHWSDTDRAEHEQMGFHDGWRMAAMQLEALAQSL